MQKLFGLLKSMAFSLQLCCQYHVYIHCELISVDWWFKYAFSKKTLLKCYAVILKRLAFNFTGNQQFLLV